METMKTWRSKLKKTGASALAAFMLCGSFSAFAQGSGEDNITTNSTTGDAQSAGNVKTVTGFQTDKAVGYAANIRWGNMVFIYDRGTYDSTNGTLVGSFQDQVNYVEAGAEITVDDQTQEKKVTNAGYWYGFDGETNAVEIENLSTEAINITATPASDGTNAGNAAFSLYVAKNKGWSDVQELSDAERTFSGCVLNTLAVGGEESAINRNFAAATRDSHGEVQNVDTDMIWLNITGEPDEGFRNQTGFTEAGNVGEKLGTITLTFTTTDTPAKTLTPKAVEETPAEQG